MFRTLFALMLVPLILSAGPGLAQGMDDEAHFFFGNDAYHAGQTVVHDREGQDDLFAAGQRVRVETALTGTAHAVGQSVEFRASVGGDLYALGQDVSVLGDVTGDVSAAGQDVRISGAVGGDLRAAGAVVSLSAPVAGTAILAGETVRLDAAITGDTILAAETAEFGEGARIDGDLTLYEEEVGAMEVPDRVAPGDRITRLEIEEWDRQEFGRDMVPVPTIGDLVGRFIAGVVMVSLLAALIAALIPDRLADMRRTTLAGPFRTLGIGFVAQSAIIGSVVVVGMTLIGLILVPAILLLAGLTALAGYVVGAYAFGVGLVLLLGREEPGSLAERAIAAAAGAFVAGLVGLIPFLGWLFVIVLSLTGIGAIVNEIRHRRSAESAA